MGMALAICTLERVLAQGALASYRLFPWILFIHCIVMPPMKAGSNVVWLCSAYSIAPVMV